MFRPSCITEQNSIVEVTADTGSVTHTQVDRVLPRSGRLNPVRVVGVQMHLP
jgi:hypothetical protein